MILLALLSGSAIARDVDPGQGAVSVQNDEAGSVLLVDGEPFLVRGMNWDHSPVGTNYRYSLWVQDDAVIERVLGREMPLLRAMGVNAIRQYDDIPPRWVAWIYERYGIRTMVNPLFGRYGLQIDGRWVPNVDYSNPAHRAAIREATLAAVERFKGTPGVLLYVLGNENNYGLSWSSFEIEQLPVGERDTARARYLYSLFGEVVDAIHAADPTHPVAIANGDVQYIDLIASEVPHLDIFGTNVYRGASARDLYAVVRQKLGIPVLYTEFGADAFDAHANREDALTQARYVLREWTDLYQHVRGQPADSFGVAGNAIGGFVFQWSDGWWKYKQDERLDVHDTNASWSNGGYTEDWAEGRNNMNEEWFGICAKGPAEADGTYSIVPRPAYYALQSAWSLDPYAAGLNPAAIADRFAAVDPAVYLPTYETAAAAGAATLLSKAYVRDLRLDTWTFLTKDSRTGEPASFDHTESATFDLGVRPAPGVEGHVAVNVLGNVASNPIDAIRYESRGRGLVQAGPDGLDLSALDRVRLYQAGLSWDNPYFHLDLYHRTGHFHWGYEGDSFGFYRDAYYGDAIDIYDADAPTGVEIHGKQALEGAAIAFGPQVYWGANPTVIAKYRRATGPLTWTAIHQEDVAAQAQVTSSRAIPQPVGRKSALSLETAAGGVKLQVAGILAGTEHLGDAYTETVTAAETGKSYSDSGYHVLKDTIRMSDTLGAKAKVSFETGRVHAYALGTYRGLVAGGGPDPTTTFTGWSLKDGGSGNVIAGLAGVALDVGHLQIAPNALVQQPLVGPLPSVAAQWDGATGWYNPALTPRNIVDDPFVVDSNRKTVGGELLLVWDPTPATWFWAWDAAVQEDAPLAGSLDIVYRHQPTSRDATIGFTEDGTLFTFAAAPAAANVWDATLKLTGRPARDLRLLATLYAGQGQSTGQDDRLVFRYGAEVTVWWKQTALQLVGRVNDWGPYDYYRTFNLTYPLQTAADLSTGLNGLRLPLAGTRLGVRGTYRTLDAYSPAADTPLGGDPNGSEFELSTYLRVGL